MHQGGLTLVTLEPFVGHPNPPSAISLTNRRRVFMHFDICRRSITRGVLLGLKNASPDLSIDALAMRLGRFA